MSHDRLNALIAERDELRDTLDCVRALVARYRVLNPRRYPIRFSMPEPPFEVPKIPDIPISATDFMRRIEEVLNG